MTTTYYQVKEKRDSTAIKINGIASDIEIGYEPQLAFPGKTLDEINRCTLITELDGGEGDNTVTARATAWGLHPQRHTTNGSVDKLVYQVGVYEDGVTKAVILVLTNGADGVYVQKFGWCNRSGLLVRMRFFQVASNGTVSFRTDGDMPDNSGTSGGYNAWGLRIHGVKVVQTSSLAFPGATLESLKDCAFIAGYRAGDGIDNPVTNNWAAFKTCWTNTANDKLEKIVMQFDAYESAYTKTAIIQLVDGLDGVYASQPCYYYKNANTVSSQKFSIADNGTVSKISDGRGGNCSAGGEGNYSVSELYAIPQCVAKYPAKIKVFSDPSKTLTLDDIKDGVFIGRLCGSWVSTKYRDSLEPTTQAYNKKVYEDEYGSVTNIIVEYQERDDDYLKCAVVSFENGVDGIYASTILAPNKNGGTPGDNLYTGQTWGSGTIAGSYTASGYAICDVRVTVPTIHSWTLDTSKTWTALSGGVTPASDEVVRITVTDPAAVLTVNEDVEIAGIEFVDGSGATLLINSGYTVTADSISGIGNLRNNGTLVKTGAGTVTVPFDRGYAATGVTIVSNGTLKASVTGSGSNCHTVRVASGATFDINGGSISFAVTLEEGAHFANNGADIDTRSQQVNSFTLEGDATAAFTRNFGFLAPNFGATQLGLGTNTFTIDGSGKSFWLCNTTITGAGTIDVRNGWITCAMDSTGADCTLKIGAGGGLRIYGSDVLSVKNFVNGGQMYNDTGTLQVTGTLTPGNNVTKLTLADGATIKSSATTAQTVTTTFNASGTITIDASEITAQQLRNAENGRIAVLTVPSAATTSGAKWKVSNEPIRDTRINWVTNGDTKTLYLAKPIGMILMVR